ncbi:hypothetical protein KQI63_08605 [bacterium]|nr:hypothetical protein [bacterium]
MGRGRSTIRHQFNRLPKRLRDRESDDLSSTEIEVGDGATRDTIARGLVALALVAIAALIMIQLFNRPAVESTATSQELQSIRDLGSGVTTLMIEEFHRDGWQRYHFSLDTSQSVDGLQQIASQLHLPTLVRDVIENKRLRVFVTTGGALPVAMADEIARRYGSYARDVFEVSCLLSWISLQGAVVPQYFGEMEEQLQDAYLASYPKVAKRINHLLGRCGMEGTMSEAYPGDPNDVLEQSFVLFEQLDELIRRTSRE